MLRTDSRKIKEGDIFLALTGKNDGHEFVGDAIDKGASEVIVEKGLYKVNTLVVKDTREYLINYLDELYKEKFKQIKLIGMTGTNGKTTTCFLTHKALNKLGKKCGYIGTIGFYIDEKIEDLNNTTPDLADLYGLIDKCVSEKCEYVVIEVSSHALDMKRIGRLWFDYAIFSNLTKDHLDYHKDMIKYAQAKRKLFEHLKENGKAIINNDSQYKNYFILKENINITYGFDGGDYHINNYTIDIKGTTFNINDEYLFETNLLGKHNIYNLICVIIVLFNEGFNYNQIKDIIYELKSPDGRMDSIIYKGNQIIVDYAHTPDALENVLEAVTRLKPNNIITIVGCGGDRDKTKRSEMAKIATNLSNRVILTSDNPRSEDPIQIINDMVNTDLPDNYEIIVERREAIEKGISLLNEHDILMILGKGHETYQIIGKDKIHFDDKEVVNNYIDSSLKENEIT